MQSDLQERAKSRDCILFLRKTIAENYSILSKVTTIFQAWQASAGHAAVGIHNVPTVPSAAVIAVQLASMHTVAGFITFASVPDFAGVPAVLAVAVIPAVITCYFL